MVKRPTLCEFAQPDSSSQLLPRGRLRASPTVVGQLWQPGSIQPTVKLQFTCFLDFQNPHAVFKKDFLPVAIGDIFAVYGLDIHPGVADGVIRAKEDPLCSHLADQVLQKAQAEQSGAGQVQVQILMLFHQSNVLRHPIPVPGVGRHKDDAGEGGEKILQLSLP